MKKDTWHKPSFSSPEVSYILLQTTTQIVSSSHSLFKQAPKRQRCWQLDVGYPGIDCSRGRNAIALVVVFRWISIYIKRILQMLRFLLFCSLWVPPAGQMENPGSGQERCPLLVTQCTVWWLLDSALTCVLTSYSIWWVERKRGCRDARPVDLVLCSLKVYTQRFSTTSPSTKSLGEKWDTTQRRGCK